ncbi:MAG TPA: kynureninase [Sphingomicrobium sp.]|nr:kynureninase [Sphingomicrobium sp.]
MTLERAREFDACDPLRRMRERFDLPDGLIYLDGNSLGALPKATSPHLKDVIERQWGKDLITSWNRHGWIDWPQRIAAKLAPIVGTKESELLVADSTTVCLFKLLAAAVAARPGRSTILTEKDNFPTDLYAAQGLASSQPQVEVKAVAADELVDALDEEVAVLFLTHVDYRSGARHDMTALNQAAHSVGALTLWDLSHSAGAVELDLGRSGFDLAVGCGYKYLNGGPGAPAFLCVANALQASLRSPLPGWMGHSDPFAFAPAFEPASGIRKFLTGTPSILSLAALEAGLDTFDGAKVADLEKKARELSSFFVACVERLCGGEVTLASPREPKLRGSHVVFAHPQGYAVMQALIARGIVGDFRPPDLMRFGFAPLYNSFEDAWRASSALFEILADREWEQPHFQERQRVT